MSIEETKNPNQTIPENAQTTIETGTFSKEQNETIQSYKKPKAKKKKKKLKIQLDSKFDPNLTNYKYKTFFPTSSLS